MNFEGMTPQQAADAISAKYFHNAHAFIADVATACQHFSNEQLERGRKHDHLAAVAEFHRAMGVPICDKPAFPSDERMDLRVRLIAEEFCEFLQACGMDYRVSIGHKSFGHSRFDTYDVFHDLGRGPEAKDLADSVDALVDLEYVIHGTSLELGIDSQPLWESVHAANMAKTGGPVVNGKIGKPEGWQPPDIEGELRKQGWKP